MMRLLHAAGQSSLATVAGLGDFATFVSLITPGLFAALIVFPILTVTFTLVGLAGGYLSGSVLLGLDSGVYWAGVHSAVQFADVRECLLKALVFGVVTIAICCHSGFT